MKAIVMTAPGTPDVLRLVDMPRPEIQSPNEMRVRLHAAGVNPIDAKLRQSALYYPERLPAVLGCDGAGVVEAVGGAVSRFRPGDEVYFFNNGIGGAPGNYAEYAVIDADFAAPKPRNASMAEAAALPLVLITAWEALFERGRLRAEETVLIHAGAGGVGHIAVQLASNSGARVLATASVAKTDFVRALGVRDVIDYRHDDFVRICRELTAGRGADLILDTVGGDTFNRSLEAVSLYGRIATLLQSPFDAELLKQGRLRNVGIDYVLMLAPLYLGDRGARIRQRRILEAGTRLVEAGKLKVHVSTVLPLAQAARAHELIETGRSLGKIVLSIV